MLQVHKKNFSLPSCCCCCFVFLQCKIVCQQWQKNFQVKKSRCGTFFSIESCCFCCCRYACCKGSHHMVGNFYIFSHSRERKQQQRLEMSRVSTPWKHIKFIHLASVCSLRSESKKNRRNDQEWFSSAKKEEFLKIKPRVVESTVMLSRVFEGQ